MKTFSALLALCEGIPLTKASGCRTSMVSLICPWTNGWANNRDAGDLRRHGAHYDVTAMLSTGPSVCQPGQWTISSNEWTVLSRIIMEFKKSIITPSTRLRYKILNNNVNSEHDRPMPLNFTEQSATSSISCLMTASHFKAILSFLLTLFRLVMYMSNSEMNRHVCAFDWNESSEQISLSKSYSTILYSSFSLGQL